VGTNKFKIKERIWLLSNWKENHWLIIGNCVSFTKVVTFEMSVFWSFLFRQMNEIETKHATDLPDR
jgi:hypothetical protein